MGPGSALAWLACPGRRGWDGMTPPSRDMIARALHFVVPRKKKREQGMPGARCTRGLVCKIVRRMRTRAYRFSGGSPAFPAQWLYGLCRALPGDEFFFVTVIRGLRLV